MRMLKFLSLLLSLTTLLTACNDDTQAIRKATASECMPDSRDYAHMWWANGWRMQANGTKQVRCVQTGYYGLAMDVEKPAILHMGALKDTVSYEEAALQDNSIITALPSADIDMAINANGKRYKCVGSEKGAKEETTGRLIDSGRFMQRADIKNLVFQDETGQRLKGRSRLEVVAWPEDLTFILETAPLRPAVPAGPSFGRIGNGMNFDGTNAIEVPDSPALEPQELTVEVWVFLPEGYGDKNVRRWLICKNLNEFDKGNYGIFLNSISFEVLLNFNGVPDEAVRLPSNLPLEEENWSHIAMTYDGKVLRAYVNGVVSAETAINKPRVAGAGPLSIGKRTDGFENGMPFQGIADEIRVYGRALTAEEIKIHAATPESIATEAALGLHMSFDNPGDAPITRPTQDWTSASLEMSMKYAGKDFATKSQAFPVWKSPDAKSVSLTLKPAQPEAPLAMGAPAGVSVEAKDRPTSQSLPASWNATQNWYGVEMTTAKRLVGNNDITDRVMVTLRNNSDHSAAIPLFIDKDVKQGIVGVSPIFRDLEGNPTGIPIQISKNWHGMPNGAPYNGTWMHGISLLRLPAKSEIDLEYSLVHAFWGGVPAVSHGQLCLLGYGGDQLWDQVAIGSWGESICYDPDVNLGRSIIDDVRPLMVKSPGGGQYTWTGNVGGGDFLMYKNADDKQQYLRRMKTAYLKYCPNLTDVVYAGVTDDGNISAKIRVSTPRLEDYARHFHTIRYDVLKPTPFKRLAFYQIGADRYNDNNFDSMAYGDTEGQKEEWNIDKTVEKYSRTAIKLDGKTPWISMHKVTPNASEKYTWASRGVIIRSWKARLGGKDVPAPYLSVYGVSPSAIMEICAPPEVQTLLPGDFVEAEFEFIILPPAAADYYGPNKAFQEALARDANTWRMVAREASGNSLELNALTGEVLHTYPIVVQVGAKQTAQVQVTGGLGYVPITFAGLKSATGHEVTVTAEGSAQVVNQSVLGNDFWQTDCDVKTKLYSLTYSIPLDSPDGKPRMVEISLGPKKR